MITFKSVTGTQAEKPPKYDYSGSPGKVYVRENIIRTTETIGEDTVEVWKYDEALLTYDEFTEYIQTQVSVSEAAQTELTDTVTSILTEVIPSLMPE